MLVYHEPSPWRVLAMYLSPMALPHEKPSTSSSRQERRKIHIRHMMRIRPFLRLYIFRSAHLILGFFIISIFFSLLLPIAFLAILAVIGFLVATLHTAFLIFLQQNINDLAAKLGKRNPEIELNDE